MLRGADSYALLAIAVLLTVGFTPVVEVGLDEIMSDLSDPDPLVRKQGIDRLADYDGESERVASILTNLLNTDEEASVRAHAALTLGRYAIASSVKPVLLKAMEDSVPEVRRAAMKTLISLSEPSSHDTIRKLEGLDNTLIVHFIDVGNGDATLFQGPDFTILVDTGRHDQDLVVLPYLRAVGVTHLDLLAITHPHVDHMGQVPVVLDAIPVDKVWMSGIEPDPSRNRDVYHRVLFSIRESGAEQVEPRGGDTFSIGSAILEVLHPTVLQGVYKTDEEINRDSLVFRLTYGEFRVLMTADALSVSEGEMILRRRPLEADVIKLGHHGANNPTTESFLRHVNPGIAVYSYGGEHPTIPGERTITRLAKRNIATYGTDIHGTIRILTDGDKIAVATEK